MQRLIFNAELGKSPGADIEDHRPRRLVRVLPFAFRRIDSAERYCKVCAARNTYIVFLR